MPSSAHSPTRRRLPVPDAIRTVGHIAWTTLLACFRYRVLGLAAETAFFSLLSIPPLIFGLAGSVGFIAQTFTAQTIVNFRTNILALASRILTTDVINTVLAPTLDDVLGAGRFDVLSIGFVLALWSGSRAMAVFVDTITIMYGHAGKRGVVQSRALSFVIYLVALLLLAVLLPLVLAGPGLVAQILPRGLRVFNALYWPVVLGGTLVLLTITYHIAVPLKRRWRADVPGAMLTLAIWLLGSWVLRLVLGRTVGSTSLYGPLAAPLALMMWLHLTSLAALIGAAFNAALESTYPRLSALTRRESDALLRTTIPTP